METRDSSALGGGRAGPDAREIQFLVLAHGGQPYLLARVRWPDVAQAVTPGCLEWQEDVGLFDLPDDPGSTPVTLDRAVDIAVGWGAHLPSEPTVGSGPLLIRRMPANWSDMPPAERRAWSLDLAPARGRNRRRSAVAGQVSPAGPVRLVRLAASLADRGRSVGPKPGRPRKKVAVSPGELAYEDTWDRVFASIPAMITAPTADEESEDDVPAPVGLLQDEERFEPPGAVDVHPPRRSRNRTTTRSLQRPGGGRQPGQRVHRLLVTLVARPRRTVPAPMSDPPSGLAGGAVDQRRVARSRGPRDTTGGLVAGQAADRSPLPGPRRG